MAVCGGVGGRVQGKEKRRWERGEAEGLGGRESVCGGGGEGQDTRGNKT